MNNLKLVAFLFILCCLGCGESRKAENKDKGVLAGYELVNNWPNM